MFDIIIGLFGLFFGVVLDRVAPEEVSQYASIVLFLRRVFLGFFVILFLWSDFSVTLFLFGLLAGFFARFDYVYLGVGIVLLDRFLFAVLLLFYGFVFGIQFSHAKIYLFLSCVLFFVSAVFISVIPFTLLSFAAGALFIQIFK